MEYIKQKLKGTAILILLLTANISFAQTDMPNFTLNSDSVVMLGENISIYSTITKSGNSLIWSQDNNGNSYVTNFVINSSSGGWDQTTSTGSTTYNMELEGFQVNFLISGDTDDITTTLTYIISETEQEEYIFAINSISYQ